ncbi:MAG TPA: flagellar FliJ family protein [Candidatus Helicobacter avistercoris]|nr:flagellar FliJ family protein [Candidatus Helicobacter avistercoris]
MKTKFDALLLGLKQRVQNCENEIASIHFQITQAQEEICSCVQEIAQMQIPPAGNAMAFRELYAGKRAMVAKMDEKNIHLSSLKAQLKNKQEEHKLIELEFEKIKYLQQKEISSMLEKIKKKQNQELDEIAVMLYAQQGGKQ